MHAGMNQPTSAVTVIGAGTMGSALAGALLAAGHAVTVWNRTAARAQPLADAGATVAGELEEAIASSETIVTCVASPAVVDELVGQPAALRSLTGRTLVQLTTGRPAEIRRGAGFARDHGIDYLGGAIMAHPRTVGTAEAVLLFGGDEAVFESRRPLLGALGTLRFLGADPGGPTAMDAALIAFFYGAISGFLHGARLTRAEGIDDETYLALAGPFLRDFIAGATADASARIVSGDTSDPQSSLETHLGGIDDLVVGTSRDAAIELSVMAAIRDEIGAAVRAGRGGQDIISLLDGSAGP
jgi:3-hydroxyisobutyrate dehydrogenase-like beta-hydroxyacid dehydrogenase